MSAKSGHKGRYITKVGYFDIYAKDTHKRDTERGKFTKPQVASTKYVIYHGKKLIEANLKTKDEAVEMAKFLLGDKITNYGLS
jgi:hypothetical protein